MRRCVARTLIVRRGYTPSPRAAALSVVMKLESCDVQAAVSIKNDRPEPELMDSLPGGVLSMIPSGALIAALNTFSNSWTYLVKLALSVKLSLPRIGLRKISIAALPSPYGIGIDLLTNEGKTANLGFPLSKNS